jgi:hypothetical protein
MLPLHRNRPKPNCAREERPEKAVTFYGSYSNQIRRGQSCLRYSNIKGARGEAGLLSHDALRSQFLKCRGRLNFSPALYPDPPALSIVVSFKSVFGSVERFKSNRTNEFRTI